MKVEITKAQIEAIKDTVEDLRAMIGCEGDDDNDVDKAWKKQIRLIDNFLNKNGL